MINWLGQGASTRQVIYTCEVPWDEPLTGSVSEEETDAMIDEKYFVSEMEARWTKDFKNVPNDALRGVWEVLAKTFNQHIANCDDGEDRSKWSILTPPTGTGKSRGTALYASLLAREHLEEHPGMLIVTRRKDDCDKYAEEINSLAGFSNAVAYHSDSPSELKPSDLKDYPCVIITHRAYEIALDKLGEGGTIQKTWDFFIPWRDGERKLIVIDEAIDLVEHSQCSIDKLEFVLGLPSEIRERFPNEFMALETLNGILKTVQNDVDRFSSREKVATPVALKSFRGEDYPDMTKLRAYLKSKEVHLDFIKNRKHDAMNNKYLKDEADKILKSAHCIYRSWVYYANHEARGTLNTAKLLVPEGMRGAVVLDATGRVNLFHELFEKADIVHTPSKARRYGNVTLYTSLGHSVGKKKMTDNKRAVCQTLLNNLEIDTRFVGRKVLVITHKGIEHEILALKDGLPFELDVTHWGQHEGTNQWDSYDTVVVFGLPYRPTYWPANLYMALRGPQSSEWLQSESRPFKGHKDVRRSIMQHQMLTDVIQGVNRIRCRKVVDDQGNCPATEVLLLLPDDDTGRFIVAGFASEMPGIVVEEWDYQDLRQKRRRSANEEVLVSYLGTLKPGRYSKRAIEKETGINSQTLKKICLNAVRIETPLYEQLQEIGVDIAIEGKGRGGKTWFIKD